MASNLKIETSDGRRNLRPGERVAITCAWQLEEPPESVEARLVWYTRGKGDQDLSVVETLAFDKPQAMGMEQGEFVLPEGPYSFSGKLISLLWTIELIAEPSGASHRADITVSPTGEEVLLKAGADDSLKMPRDKRPWFRVVHK